MTAMLLTLTRRLLFLPGVSGLGAASVFLGDCLRRASEE